MGNTQHSNQIEQQYQRQPVIPFIQGQKVTKKSQEESKLNLWINQRICSKNETDRELLNQYSMREQTYEKNTIKNIFAEVRQIEESFSPEQLEKIRDLFDIYSFENKMGKKKCLEYFGLIELQELNLGNQLFQCIKQVYPSNLSGPYLDYTKFLKAISMLSCENKEGRIKLTYEMFDQKQKSFLEREDIQYMMESIYDFLMGVNVHNQQFNELKQEMLRAHERDIDAAMMSIVENIMMQFSNPDQGGIDYQGYQKWVLSQKCLDECFQYNPHESMYED